MFIILAVLVEAIDFLQQIDLSQLFGHRVVPATRHLRHHDARDRHAHRDRDRDAHRDAGRAGVGDLPRPSTPRPKARRAVKPVLEVLAGIPSVVLGFFALTLITPYLIKPLFAEANAFNLAAAGIGVGILTVPLVASVAEDAMRAVPDRACARRRTASARAR